MLPNLLTPPNEPFTEATTGDGVGYPGANEVVTQHFVATPVSNINMGLDEQDEMAITGRPDEHIMTDEDEDEDMSEGGGGAPLTMTLSHAEALNAELDALDAELMGPQNLVELYLGQHFHQLGDPYPDPFQEDYPTSHMDQPEPSQDVHMHGTGNLHGSGSLVNLPSAMSQVSLHLQHLQEEQEHAESAEAEDEPHMAHMNNIDEPFNLSLGDFLYHWGMSVQTHEDSKKRSRGPFLSSITTQRKQKLAIMQRSDLSGEDCDIQRINWTELGVSRSEARQVRRGTYRNYQNLRLPNQWHPRLNGARLSDDQDFFRFRRMDFDHRVNLSHFQLRNLMACASRDNVFYAGRSKIMHWNPRSGILSGRPTVAMDLTDPAVQSFHSTHHGVQISTLAIGHEILVAGGFNGEYGLVNLRSPKEAKHAEGIITDSQNSITNHVQVHLSRSSSLPLVAFASNDMGMRILDVNTNTFIAEHRYEHAINCTAMSPDQRLRVLVGDTRQVMICNAETGEVLQSLDGHRDFGFACDWADDGWTVATGNQDMQVKIWDARKWKSSSGLAQPLATIAAEMAGVRKLKFSPLGSGKRVLLAAEPADIISVIDADSFTSKQTLSFFGEIAGVDFTNGGRDLLVANCDNMRGGIMEFERCDLAGNDFWELDPTYYGRKEHRCHRPRDGYDWISDNEVTEHPKARGTKQQRTRIAAASEVCLPFF